jgi:glycosyltransferase involved in cell wall biosynthesis
MKRVLHILPGLQPNDGISTVFMNYLQHIDHSNFCFDVICHWPFHPDYKELVESFGGSVTYLPRITLSNIKSTSKAIKNYFCEHPSYDIVHCHMANAAFLYLSIAEKNHVSLRVIHGHQDHYADSFAHALRNIPLVALGKRHANCNIACSLVAGNFLFGNKAFSVLHNSIDTKKFCFSNKKRFSTRKKLGFDSNQLIFGSVGRLTAQKNQSFVLDVFHRIKLCHPNSVLLMIGEGAMRDELVKKAKFLGISDNVRWMENVVDMDSIYQGLDALLFPSLYEGLPLTLVEAQASGLACFVSDKISEEALMTDRALPLPINSGADIWSNAIESVLGNPNYCVGREKYAQIVADAGFDIRNTAADLTTIYDSQRKQNMVS